jgi:hypothetical protein
LTLLVLETAFLQDSQLAYTRVCLLNKQSLWAITLGALLWLKLVFHILRKTNCRWTFNSNFDSYSLKAVVFSKFQYIVLQGIDYMTFFCGRMQDLKERHEGFQVEEAPLQSLPESGQDLSILCSSQ